MLKRLFTYFFISIFGSLLFISCAKDENTDEDPTNGGGNPSTSEFSWTVNNGSTVSANDYFFVASFNNIVGKKPEIGLM